MIVTIANHKGGVGKTTTALTLAHLLHLEGAPVVVVDLDAPSRDRRAGAAAALRRAEALGIPAYTLNALPAEVEGDVIIDGPPDASDPALERALRASDWVIIPSTLSFDDLEVSRVFYDTVDTRQKALLLTQVPHYHDAKAQARINTLKAERVRVLSAMIPRLEAYPKAAEEGSTVAGIDRLEFRRAARPYEALLREIQGSA